MKTILLNSNVIPCTGDDLQPGRALVIDDGRITAIKPGDQLAPQDRQGARTIDLQGKYVLPGLWDVHEHLGDIYPDPKYRMMRESVADRTIRAGRNCLDAIRVGITGVRVVGEAHYIDVAWREAFNSGLFVGPRLFVCGQIILATGGHGHGWPGAIEVDGPYEMRKAVREQLKNGADQIKISVTGGVQTPGETMTESQLLMDEVQAAVEIAHNKGKRVAVHAGGPAGIKTAIRAGVDCIEHGYYLDDESVELMAEKDLYYVPTLAVTQYEPFMEASGMADYQLEKARGAMHAHREGFQKAVKAGIKIVSGADLAPIAKLGLVEIEQLVRAGMSEMQALIAATRNAADLCGVLDQVGTLETGKLADLIVLDQNPLEDIANIRRLALVMREGNLVDTRPAEGLADFWEMYFT